MKWKFFVLFRGCGLLSLTGSIHMTSIARNVSLSKRTDETEEPCDLNVIKIKLKVTDLSYRNDFVPVLLRISANYSGS